MRGWISLCIYFHRNNNDCFITLLTPQAFNTATKIVVDVEILAKQSDVEPVQRGVSSCKAPICSRGYPRLVRWCLWFPKVKLNVGTDGEAWGQVPSLCVCLLVKNTRSHSFMHACIHSFLVAYVVHDSLKGHLSLNGGIYSVLLASSWQP